MFSLSVLISPSNLTQSCFAISCSPYQIQESVLGGKHKVVLNTKDSLNFVNQCIKSRDSPPPPPSTPREAKVAEAESKSSTAPEKSSSSSMFGFGLFGDYLTCNVAKEIEAWVEETKMFPDSVRCNEVL